jgi:Flp pilus assembly protein TadD
MRARAHAHFKLAELTEAVADYSELIQREPENAEAYNARGVAHRDMNDFGAVYELMGSNDRDATAH